MDIKIKEVEDKVTDDMEKITFVLKGRVTSGTGRLLSNEKFEILKGTSIVLEVKSENPTTFKRNKNLIDDLLRKNLIEKLRDKYIFKENYIATSPSAAAIPPAAPHKPIIFVRFIWSEYISAIKTSELGTTMAAPMP